MNTADSFGPDQRLWRGESGGGGGSPRHAQPGYSFFMYDTASLVAAACDLHFCLLPSAFAFVPFAFPAFYAISSRDRSRSWLLSGAGGLPGLTARRVRIPAARAALSSPVTSDTNTTASGAMRRLSAIRV